MDATGVVFAVDLIPPSTGPGWTAPGIRSDSVSLVTLSSARTPSPLRSAQHCAFLALSPSLPCAWLPPLHDVVHTQTPLTCIAQPSSPSPPPAGYGSPTSGRAGKRSSGRDSTLPRTRSRCAGRRYRRWTGRPRSARESEVISSAYTPRSWQPCDYCSRWEAT